MRKFNFGWALPRTQLGDFAVLLQTCSWFWGPTSKGKERKRKKGGKGREPKPSPNSHFWLRYRAN